MVAHPRIMRLLISFPQLHMGRVYRCLGKPSRVFFEMFLIGCGVVGVGLLLSWQAHVDAEHEKATTETLIQQDREHVRMLDQILSEVRHNGERIASKAP